MITSRRGFTLIELILVILVMSIVSISVASFIRFGIDIYQDTVNRDRQVGDSRFLIERLTRELREAVPNSIRVNNSCIEFVPIVVNSTYISIPVMPDSSDELLVVESTRSGGSKIIIYPLSPQEIYAPALTDAAKIFEIDSMTDEGNNVMEISFANAISFLQHSPIERYFLVDSAVSYCVEGQDIKRYGDYWPGQNQLSPPNATGVLMVKNQVNATPFEYHQDSLIRNAVVQLNLSFSYDDELLNLYHEVHIVNVP